MGNDDTRVFDLAGFSGFNANSLISAPLQQPHIYSQVKYRHHLSLQGIGYTGYASSFQDGLLMYDLRQGISNPDGVLAQVDTSICEPGLAAPGCMFPHEGNFAVHRHQDSGVLYVSDWSNGLYFVRANVGHVNRYGKGSPEMVGGVPRIPRITVEAAPPRTRSPGKDLQLEITIRNLAPGRHCVIEVNSEGRNSSIPYAPAPAFAQWGGGWLLDSIMVGPADGNGVIKHMLATAGIPDQFRLFLQAFSYDISGPQFTCVASSRGTWFGMAAPQ